MSKIFFRRLISNKNFIRLSSKFNKLSTENSSNLLDHFGRNHTYLRISLSERCNLRCGYCMPEEGVQLSKNDKLLTSFEIVKLAKLFTKNGVNKIRFTGGEPLIRKDSIEIIREIGKIDGIKKLAITTNGILLAKKLNDLKAAGVSQLNISLDTLKEKKFEFITKRNGWSKVMHSIDASLDIGFNPLKVKKKLIKTQQLFSFFSIYSI
jgi:molybdenum cofactor biosynthesis enzyme MoaA